MSSFFIWSALSSNSYGSYGLNVQNANNSPGTPIILYPWGGGAPNELWTLDSDNHLLTGLGPDLVIGIESNAVVLCALSAGDSSQQWVLSNGMLQNQQNSMVISAVGDPQSGFTLTLIDAPTTPSPNQVWQYAYNLPLPVSFVAQWCNIQATTSQGDLYFLDTDASQTVSGTAAVLRAPVSSSVTQRWLITPDGRVLNNGGSQLVLSFAGAVQGGSGNEVTVSSQSNPVGSTQQWSFEDYCLINVGSSVGGVTEYLTSIDGNVQTITTTPDNWLWFNRLPQSPLPIITTAGPQPFPDFQGSTGQTQAYQSILSSLQAKGFFPGDLRANYPNLDLTADFGLWGAEINLISAPSSISPSDWSAVVNQLTTELNAVAAVQTLFANYNNYHSQLFESQEATVNSLIAAVGLEIGTPQEPFVSGSAFGILTNIAYVLLQAIPGDWTPFNFASIGSNIMQCVLNTTVGAPSGPGQISPSPFQVRVSALWQQLNANFLAMLTSAGNMFNAILCDYGKLSATFALIQSSGPDSLSWTAEVTSQLIAASQSGFSLGVLQMLMPAKYQIYWINQKTNTLSNIPANLQMSSSQLSDGSWNVYWIADSTDSNAVPSSYLVEALTGNPNGELPSDVFLSQNGWGFAQAEMGEITIDWGTSQINVMLCNQTFNYLVVSMDPKNAGEKGANICAYGSAMIWDTWGAGDGLNMYFSIMDYMISTTDPVITFLASIASAQGSTPTVSNIVTSSGYQLSSPICNIGFDSDSYGSITGTVQVTITYFPVP
jgi:hypothetical protein